MQKLRAYLSILAGLALILLAVWQMTITAKRAWQPTSTPDTIVLETYAPGTGPVAVQQPTLAVSPIAPVIAGQFLSADETAAPAPPLPTQPDPAIPTRIVIPAIDLDAPVLLAGSQKIRLGSDTFYQWTAPDEYAAGWHTSTAYLSEPGNTVLNGHNNVHGAVFGRLFRLKPGDPIDVYSGQRVFHYQVTQSLVLQETDVPASQRLANARWLGHSDDVRLTLVTCWPNDTNTHRLIIVAAYLGRD